MPKPASTSARGYGWQHQQERKRWAATVDSGNVTCARCGRSIEPGTAWDLDHAPNGAGYLGPSHARCNRKAGSRKAAALRTARARRRKQGAVDAVTTLRW